MLTASARAHRRDVALLASTANNDLRLIFEKFDSATAARDGLIEVLPRLTAIYGDASAALAADWYDDLREAAQVPGRFSPVPAELPGRGRTDALARWGVSPLFGPEPNYALALVNVAGGLQRIIANADRATIQGSSIDDKRARGWAREGVGECAFCQMLIGRGAVYTEATADFETHDRCGCVAVPAF